MNAIAKSYWRSVQRGVRIFSQVPDSMKEAVRVLVWEDVESGALDREDYRNFIGENFPEF